MSPTSKTQGLTKTTSLATPAATPSMQSSLDPAEHLESLAFNLEGHAYEHRVPSEFTTGLVLTVQKSGGGKASDNEKAPAIRPTAEELNTHPDCNGASGYVWVGMIPSQAVLNALLPKKTSKKDGLPSRTGGADEEQDDDAADAAAATPSKTPANKKKAAESLFPRRNGKWTVDGLKRGDIRIIPYDPDALRVVIKGTRVVVHKLINHDDATGLCAAINVPLNHVFFFREFRDDKATTEIARRRFLIKKVEEKITGGRAAAGDQEKEKKATEAGASAKDKAKKTQNGDGKEQSKQPKRFAAPAVPAEKAPAAAATARVDRLPTAAASSGCPNDEQPAATIPPTKLRTDAPRPASSTDCVMTDAGGYGNGLAGGISSPPRQTAQIYDPNLGLQISGVQSSHIPVSRGMPPTGRQGSAALAALKVMSKPFSSEGGFSQFIEEEELISPFSGHTRLPSPLSTPLVENASKAGRCAQDRHVQVSGEHHQSLDDPDVAQQPDVIWATLSPHAGHYGEVQGTAYHNGFQPPQPKNGWLQNGVGPPFVPIPELSQHGGMSLTSIHQQGISHPLALPYTTSLSQGTPQPSVFQGRTSTSAERPGRDSHSGQPDSGGVGNQVQVPQRPIVTQDVSQGWALTQLQGRHKPLEISQPPLVEQPQVIQQPTPKSQTPQPTTCPAGSPPGHVHPTSTTSDSIHRGPLASEPQPSMPPSRAPGNSTLAHASSVMPHSPIASEHVSRADQLGCHAHPFLQPPRADSPPQAMLPVARAALTRSVIALATNLERSGEFRVLQQMEAVLMSMTEQCRSGSTSSTTGFLGASLQAPSAELGPEEAERLYLQFVAMFPNLAPILSPLEFAYMLLGLQKSELCIPYKSIGHFVAVITRRMRRQCETEPGFRTKFDKRTLAWDVLMSWAVAASHEVAEALRREAQSGANGVFGAHSSFAPAHR